MRRHALAATALLLLVAVSFAPVVDNGFINYDDDVYITANPLLEEGFSGRTLRWALTSLTASNWHPLTWISHQADVAFFGRDPRGHHLTSLALHAANTLLLYLLLQRWTGAAWRSAAVAALFGVHPLHVESVAWAAERKDVLSTLFLLLTLIAYGRYARRRSPACYGAVVLLLALGLLAKPMLVTVPILLLVADYWPLGRLRAPAAPAGRGGSGAAARTRLLVEKLPLLALALASGLVTVYAQTAGGALKTFEELPFLPRLGNALVSPARYLGKALWPQGLAIFYPHPGRSLPPAQIVLAVLLLAAVTALALCAARRRPYILAGWAWYLIAIAPVLGLVQVGAQAVADRYTYVPLTGVFVLAAWGAADLADRSRLRTALALATLALLLPLAAAARLQTRTWRDSVSVFEHALAVTDRNFVAHDNLAAALRQQGRNRESMLHALAAVRIHPDRGPARYLRLGRALLGEGLNREAAEVFEMALRLKPSDQEIARLLALARARQ